MLNNKIDIFFIFFSAVPNRFRTMDSEEDEYDTLFV